MTSRTDEATGRIYDLGYRPYDGQRLGGGYTGLSLFLYSLRSIFGFGRSTVTKVFAIGLAVIAFIPAFIQLGVAAIAAEDFEVLTHEDYFGFISVVLALFCAFAAPEVIGRDQRFRTLSLYFSRALSRTSYVSANLAAMATALFGVLLLPQVVLLLGNAVATDSLVDYLKDNVWELGPILASALLVGALMASLSLAVACWTPRRAFATGAVLAYFIVFTVLGEILADTTTGEVQRYVLFVAPLSVLEGAVLWVFSASPEPSSALAMADLNGGYYWLAACAYLLVSVASLYRRFNRMTV